MTVERIQSGGFCLRQSVVCSNACAIFNKVSSPNGLPSSCKPIGSFGVLVNPHGKLKPQIPARLQEIVKISDKYICNGSSDFSPILNAAVGVVGVTMASTCSNAFRKSLRISVPPLFWGREKKTEKTTPQK